MNKLLKKICFSLCLILLININVFSHEVNISSDHDVVNILSPDQGLFNFFKKRKKKKKRDLRDQKENTEKKLKEDKLDHELPNFSNNNFNEDKFLNMEGSSILICDNSIESYEFALEIIKNANWSIEMSLCMTGGNIFQKIISVTKQRMLEKTDLKVFLMLEPIFLDEKDRDIINQLQKEFSNRFFVSWTGFAPTSFPNANVHQRHSKFLVVDQRYFVLGGTNFEDLMCTHGDCIPEDIKSPRRYMFTERPLAFRDQDVVCCSDKIARELRKEFHYSFKLWEHFFLTQVFIKDPYYFKSDNYFFEKDEKLSCIVDVFHCHSDIINVSNNSLEVFFSGPQYDENTAPITKKYIDLINGAQKEILIANLYFVPYKDLLNALVDKAKDSINMEIIGNGSNDKSPRLVEVYCWGNRYNYVSLLFGRDFYLWEKFFAQSLTSNENVNIYEYYIDNTQLHKKVMIIDENKFVIGSYNFCLKSHNIDQEVVLVIDSSEVAKKAKKIFEKDKMLSQKLSPNEILDWHFNLYCHSQGFIQTKYMPA